MTARAKTKPTRVLGRYPDLEREFPLDCQVEAVGVAIDMLAPHARKGRVVGYATKEPLLCVVTDGGRAVGGNGTTWHPSFWRRVDSGPPPERPAKDLP